MLFDLVSCSVEIISKTDQIFFAGCRNFGAMARGGDLAEIQEVSS